MIGKGSRTKDVVIACAKLRKDSTLVGQMFEAQMGPNCSLISRGWCLMCSLRVRTLGSELSSQLLSSTEMLLHIHFLLISMVAVSALGTGFEFLTTLEVDSGSQACNQAAASWHQEPMLSSRGPNRRPLGLCTSRVDPPVENAAPRRNSKRCGDSEGMTLPFRLPEQWLSVPRLIKSV